MLRAVTARFYDTCASSFGATRSRPWEGWRRLLPRFACCFENAQLEGHVARVLDLGCGNFRFERFLQTADLPPWEAVGLDACSQLAGDAPTGCAYEPVDLAQWEPGGLEEKGYDAVVAFGFLHHIPGTRARESLMARMAGAARPGGLVAVSLWQLQKDAILLARAQEATARFAGQHLEASLDEGDWLLGWQGRHDVFRYCHSFSDAECERLAALPSLELEETFDADRCNRYLILRKTGRTKLLGSQNDR